MSALPEPQRFEAMPRSHEWGFCLPELLLPVQLDPINGFDTAINQLPAAPLRSLVFLFAVKPGIGSEKFKAFILPLFSLSFLASALRNNLFVHH